MTAAKEKAQNLIRFNPDQVEWTSWKSLLKNYLSLTETTAAKQKEVLINSLELRAFQDVVSACRPKDPTEFSYDELLKKLDDIYIKVTYQTTEWASFFRTRQQSSQSLVQFSNELRNRTYTCKFPGAILEDLLSAVFVAGVHSDTTRRHLMSQELKSFDETLQLARRFETGQEQAKMNNNLEEDIPTSVKVIRKAGRGNAARQQSPRKTKPCYRCVLGACYVGVKRDGGSEERLMELIVVEEGTNVLGRDWITAFNLQHHKMSELAIGQVHEERSLESILKANKNLFREELGCCRTFQAHLHLKPDAVPKYCKPRPVPFALREPVEKDIERLERLGVLERIERSAWAAPIVVVRKQGGAVRICADLSTGLNDALDVQRYPLPLPDELFAILNGGEEFTTIDMSDAYHQVPLDEASPPSIFQQMMEELLNGIPYVAVYMDDIIITGRTRREHLANLAEVAERMNRQGFTLKQQKCNFLQLSVEYLGFVVDRNGRHVSETKIRAIMEMPAPVDVAQVRSFLGMINHYGKFIHQLATKTYCLNALLKVDVKWEWSGECDGAFRSLKAELAQATMLVHYDPAKPLILAADASQYGIGAVISHRGPSGEDQPIAHASKTLTQTEQRYAQIEKEALALVFGVKKFDQYLAGREFTLLTDHKPLVTVFGRKTGIPAVSANRLQRWAIALMAYTFTIEYRSTDDFGQADGLSRLPLHSKDIFDANDWGMHEAIHAVQMEVLRETPVDAMQIASETGKDRVLARCRHLVLTGWPDKAAPDLQPYHQRRLQLSVVAGCILWGARTVIPTSLQPALLKHLHATHAGMWPEVIKMRRTQSGDVIAVLEHLCGRYGYPKQLVTDNGPQFTSAEFADYCKENGIAHLRTAPGHPQSNGQAERYVGAFKDAMTKMLADNRANIDDALRKYLFRYRTTPQATTGSSPDELFLKRRMRTALDLVHPDANETRQANMDRHKRNFDQHAKAKNFHGGQLVLVRDFRHGPKTHWTPGQLRSKKGNRQWTVTVDGQEWFRHEDQIRPREWRTAAEPNDVTSPTVPKAMISEIPQRDQQPAIAEPVIQPQPEPAPRTELPPVAVPATTNPAPPLRVSARANKGVEPIRYGYTK
ncbi:uncharacterized protein LOC129595549 [Paramacrobiotus metropolitanus]|uniref:uncharacterized protein LOC129595549 n=1 Tax=Paramacrobiotus metropolitanus TaxID=2943436 RepID=UPI002445AE73|nr:uncharacterized protein LOC129595549 [Paramacrobiotus metropolitanus]